MPTQPSASPSPYHGPSVVLDETDLATARIVRIPYATYVLAEETHNTRVFVRAADRPYTSRSPVRITLHAGLTFTYQDAGMGTMEIRVRC